MNDTLRIAIPTEGPGGIDATRSAHFGHAASFTVVDVADGAISGAHVVTNPPHTHGGCGMTVAMLAQDGVKAAIVVGMGGGPLAAMSANGMTAYYDASSPTPRAAVEAYLGAGLPSFGQDHTCAGH